MTDWMKIMVVDDEKIVRESFKAWFGKFGYQVDTAASAIEALEKIEETSFDLLFVDIKMPGMNGIALLERVKESYPETFVVIITAYGTIDSAVEAMKKGATDYLLKPFRPEQLSLVAEKISKQKELIRENIYLRERIAETTRFENLIGRSKAMHDLFELITEVAETDSSVLISGETGTGKELVAKAIHAKSHRANGPFIAINCGAIPDSLLESELFGHERGAFTGATQKRRGFLEAVYGGTLFLDEIGEISKKMQVDLLRVLEEKSIRRLGGRNSIGVDFRLITATRSDLEKEIFANRFREDLYYRINVIQIQLPPLREKKEDIPLLVDHFLKRYSLDMKKKIDHVSKGAIRLLTEYEWPGNVRELENAVERAVVLARTRTIDSEAFFFLKPLPEMRIRPRSIREVEIQHILHILNECEGNVTKAAKILGINRVTLHKKIRMYKLNGGK